MPRSIAITGAGTGIGAALARRLAGPDVNLTLHTRQNQTGLEAVAATVRESGGQAVCCLGDVRDASTSDTLVATAMETYGALDGVVAVAGFADFTAMADLTDDQIVNSFEAIDLAFLRLARSCHAALSAATAGRLIAVSSFVAHLHRLDGNHLPASAMAKAGLEAAVRSLAVEWADDGITVNCVVPGFIEKDNVPVRRNVDVSGAHSGIPQGRLGTPDEVAAAIEFLLSLDASYITGQRLHVDGGLTL